MYGSSDSMAYVDYTKYEIRRVNILKKWYDQINDMFDYKKQEELELNKDESGKPSFPNDVCFISQMPAYGPFYMVKIGKYVGEPEEIGPSANINNAQSNADSSLNNITPDMAPNMAPNTSQNGPRNKSRKNAKKGESKEPPNDAPPENPRAKINGKIYENVSYILVSPFIYHSSMKSGNRTITFNQYFTKKCGYTMIETFIIEFPRTEYECIQMIPDNKMSPLKREILSVISRNTATMISNDLSISNIYTADIQKKLVYAGIEYIGEYEVISHTNDNTVLFGVKILD